MKNNGLNKIFKKIEDIDEKQRYYIFIGLLVLVFLMDYFILMRPQLKTLTKISPEIKVLSDTYKKANDDIKKLDEYENQVAGLKENLKTLSLKISSKDEVPLILQKISLLADASGVKIEQIMPQSDELELLLEGNSKKFYSIPIRIEAKSGYHSFARFVNSIENGDIYLEVDDFTIKSANNSRRHDINLTLLAVVFENVNDQSK